MNRLPMLFTAVLLAGGAWGCVLAASIHKWVDEKGVTHYSDEAPDSPAVEVTQLDIGTGARSAEKSVSRPENYYSIANQWQRMNRERLQQRQFELQRAAISAAAVSRSAPAPVQAAPQTKRYVALYQGRRHHRHGHRQGHHGQAAQQPRSGFPSVID